jgi:hypothetical protein
MGRDKVPDLLLWTEFFHFTLQIVYLLPGPTRIFFRHLLNLHFLGRCLEELVISKHKELEVLSVMVPVFYL